MMAANWSAPGQKIRQRLRNKQLPISHASGRMLKKKGDEKRQGDNFLIAIFPVTWIFLDLRQALYPPHKNTGSRLNCAIGAH
jgi:hypothetical protein